MIDRNLLPSIVAFIAVAREGGFTRGAGQLGVSPSALSQTIRALEARLGVRLLNRSTRSVSVTEGGRRLLMLVEPNLVAISNAIDSIADPDDQPRGELKINAPRIVVPVFLEPYLGEFSRRYPDVRLEIVVDDGLGDIVREGCDAGIRLLETVPDSMTAIPVTPPVAMAVVGSPAYLAANPAPTNPTHLARHRCIGYRQSGSAAIYKWEFTDPSSEADLSFEPDGCFITNNDDVMVSGAVQGLGLAMTMDFSVRDHLTDGRLVRLLEDWCPPFDGFQLYLSSREQMPKKLRAFVDFMVEKRRLAL